MAGDGTARAMNARRLAGLKAAAQGDAEAEFSLGVLYATGRGVARDDAQAVNWYRKAAEHGLGWRAAQTWA